MQVIEGDKKDINQLLENISKDNRHHNMIILMNAPVKLRSFPDWTMGFSNTSGEETKGFSEFLNYNSQREEDRILPGKAKTLLINFKKHNTMHQGVISK